MIQLQINGEKRELPGPTPLTEFLRSKEIDPRFIVVEHNGEIARRNAYEDVILDDGDVLEIVHMMGGGAFPQKSLQFLSTPVPGNSVSHS